MEVTAIAALSSAMGTAASGVEGVIGTAVGHAVPVAGTILAITVGWRMFRNFTRG